jgi:hypothetical protein
MLTKTGGYLGTCWIKHYCHFMLLESPVESLRDAVSFPHASEIVKPFGMLEQVLDWCKSELIGEWRWSLVEVSSDKRPGRYIFYFDSEQDYLVFLLKWG